MKNYLVKISQCISILQPTCCWKIIIFPLYYFSIFLYSSVIFPISSSTSTTAAIRNLPRIKLLTSLRFTLEQPRYLISLSNSTKWIRYKIIFLMTGTNTFWISIQNVSTTVKAARINISLWSIGNNNRD